MNLFVDYNINNYVDSIVEVRQMVLDAILNPYKKCKKYSLSNGVSEYLRYIEEKPFYVPPLFRDIKTNKKMSTLNPKFILLSAPGATGKSSLAKHIAYKYDALYWNLAKVKIGTNSFAGSILHAVGAAKYSEFIGDLNTGEVLLVIDAFDEAEVVSGRRMLSSFIIDISDSITDHQHPTVFLLARTETAQYLASFCAENDIAVLHYEIDFFNEETAKKFIIKSIVDNESPTKADIDCVSSYYNTIKQNITTEECTSFLGYAPVLEAISAHIKESPNRQKMISELTTQKDCVSIIMKIMDDLLMREQTEKFVNAFRSKCAESHFEFTDWNRVYSPEEQLVRIIYYILIQDTSYTNYPIDFIPSQLVDDYQEILDSFLPQHPFVHNFTETTNDGKNIDFTGPAFRDYVLAKIILSNNKDYEILADTYFEESQSPSYFPSQIFFDCYTKIANNVIQCNHISYVYDSFKAKATAYECPYLQCSEIPASGTDVNAICKVVFGMITGKQQEPKHDEYMAEIHTINVPLQFEQLVNISIDAPNMTVNIGRMGVDARIYNSSIICKNINWMTRNIIIESYAPEGCLLVAHDGFSGDSAMIDIVNENNLKVCAPNLNSYYKLIPYKYDFEDVSKLDITKYTHALRCILIEFRTHGKDTLAKTSDRIDFVTVGNSDIKKQVLEYLKYCGIIYTSDHLYKIDESKLQAKGIYFSALYRMDAEQMKEAFKDFCEWTQK